MSLSRRTFLQGAGTALALPFLEAMLPRRAHAQMEVPKRLLAFYVPNGIVMNEWTPSATGADYALTRILAPLAPHKDELLVLSGISNLPARPDGPGDHASGTGAFLTAAHPFKTEGSNIRNGISMDQVLANAIGDATRFPSLQLGSEGGSSTGGCDSGYSCAYARNISWAGPSTPLAKEVNPQAVFDRLFAGDDPGATMAAQRKRQLYKQSVLDFVKEDARALKTKLGKTDRGKLEEYETGVRELEQRLQTPLPAPTCTPGARPGAGGDYRDAVRAMCDLMVLAFQCDRTRVITYMLGNAGSNRVYRHLGISEGHHQISHHQGLAENLSRLVSIDIWELEQLAYLLGRMKAVVEPNGTLLDNSLVFFSSEIEDGNAHRHTNLPIILAGRAGGIRPGRHVRYSGGPPIANLFISMLGALGVPTTSFGLDGTAALGQLT